MSGPACLVEGRLPRSLSGINDWNSLPTRGKLKVSLRRSSAQPSPRYLLACLSASATSRHWRQAPQSIQDQLGGCSGPGPQNR